MYILVHYSRYIYIVYAPQRWSCLCRCILDSTQIKEENQEDEIKKAFKLFDRVSIEADRIYWGLPVHSHCPASITPTEIGPAP
jgi:hypothetical protein